MKINVEALNITAFTGDTIIVNLFEGVTAPGGVSAVDRALDGIISQLIADGEITGKLNSTTVIHTLGKIPARRVVVVGLGKSAAFTRERARQAAGSAVKAARRANAKNVATIVHGAGIGGLDPAQAAQAVTEGTLLALYHFKKYVTSTPEGGDVQSVTLAEMDTAKVSALESGLQRGVIYANATNFARDLINEPGNVLNPAYLAEQAEFMARELGLEVGTLDRKQMEEMAMGSILAVAQGSHQPPKLIVLRYWGAGKDDTKPVMALLGKAVTFDSGGISIKPSDNMEAMRGDMAGGAAVLGAMHAIAHLKPKINVTALVPAVENMPGGGASRPGDIVKTMSGKTYEINSTDAEGRMILADALTYARKLGCSFLVDVATLTGAVVIALGAEYTGAFSNNKGALDKVLAAAEESGEKVWPMPTDDEYKHQLKSEVADMKNIGGRAAGSITGALFIGAFAEDTPWVHLDIAGTSSPSDNRERPYQPKFGTGVMTRTLAVLAEQMANQGR